MGSMQECYVLFCKITSRNTPPKITVVRPLTSHFKKHPSKTKMICGILLEKLGQTRKRRFFTPTYGRASVDRPTRIYLHKLYVATGCNMEDLPEGDGR